MVTDVDGGHGESLARAAPWATLRLADWWRLLAAEKRRRGVGAARLVFVGMHNVADVWWCAAKAVRKARERELTFFQAYLQDRLAYSQQLGRVRQLPAEVEDWLTVGDDLTLSDINELLRRRSQPVVGQVSNLSEAATGWKPAPPIPVPGAPQPDVGQGPPMVVAQEKDGVLYVDPTLSAGRKEWCADWAARMGWQLADAEQNPKLWAEMVEARRSERHATIRWHFGWEHYVLVSVPDGLTETSVYEFRVARVSDVARRFVKPVAVAQADLGGHFFGRSTKRVQICILKTDTISTLDEPVDPERAAETLRIFRNVDAGQPAAPPAAWKCQPGRCDYVATCTVRRQASPAR